MTRDVICNITNNTPYSYYPSTNLYHGQDSPTNAQPVQPNQVNGLAFSFTKTDWSAHGVTGVVTYQMNDGSNLVLNFNNPYTQDGTSGGGNCWFYAGFTNVAQGGTSYWVELTVAIDGQPMDPTNPPFGEVVTANVTINNQ